MAPSKYLTIRVSDEIAEALDAHCRKHGVDKSDVVRVAVCTAIGRDDLASGMKPRGRPKKADPPPARKRKSTGP